MLIVLSPLFCLPQQVHSQPVNKIASTTSDKHDIIPKMDSKIRHFFAQSWSLAEIFLTGVVTVACIIVVFANCGLVRVTVLVMVTVILISTFLLLHFVSH